MRFTMLILLALLPCFAITATLTVKQDGSGDYTVIQAALDAANPGDTVLVHPGRYFENLTMQTNNISLMSLEGTTGDPTYIDSTIVDGSMIYPVLIVSLNMQNVYIRGLSLTNGFGTGLSIWPSSLSVINCHIYNNTARSGGGIVVAGATLFMSGVKVFNNYALQLGGGIYASEGDVHTNIITFDPMNRCSIYNNRAGAGQDIYIQDATSNLNLPLDTFSVADPKSYHAVYLSNNPLSNNYQIHFDIQNAHHQEIDSDLYVSTIGNDANDGLSPATALKTIHEAIYRIAADSLNQKTVHILPGEYSRTDNDQIFPIALKSWVIVQGSGIDTTTVIGEPHPLIYENTSVLIFTAYEEPAIWLTGLSIRAREVNRYSTAIKGGLTIGRVNFYDLHISDMGADDSYSGVYSVISLSTASDKGSIWDNVTVENVSPAKQRLIYISSGITDNGMITAMSGKFSNCTFRNATSTYTSGSVMGPPLISISGDKSLEFENCVFENLSVADNDANVMQIHGIQYPQQQNHFSFKNSLFSNITSHDNMILISSKNNPRIDITNCTFAGNQGNAYTLMVNGEVNIVNSIFDNDTPYQIKINPMDGNPNEQTNLTIDHSLIRGGVAAILPYPVPGNTIDFLPSSFSADPLFVGGFDIHDPLYYSLSSASPCLDAGTPDISGLGLPPYDLAGNWRVWNGRIDMGAFEYGSQPWVSIDDPVAPALPETSITAYPNPFSAFTNIKVSLANQMSKNSINKALVKVYNLKGQLINTIALDPTKTAEQIVHWDGRDSAGRPCANGIYFLQLQIDGLPSGNKKVTLIK